MYVIVYQPQKADPEAFGPFQGPEMATRALRELATQAGVPLSDLGGGPLATADVYVDGERHRYQLVKIGSVLQLEAHGHILRELAEAGERGTGDEPPPVLSGY